MTENIFFCFLAFLINNLHIKLHSWIRLEIKPMEEQDPELLLEDRLAHLGGSHQELELMAAPMAAEAMHLTMLQLEARLEMATSNNMQIYIQQIQ